MLSNNTEIAVVGGGVSGLAIAYLLSRSGYKVTVFEQADMVGGLAGTFPLNGTYLDKYYRHLFAGHAEIIRVIKELGLGDKLTFTETNMGFYSQGALFPFNGALDLLRFKPISLFDRLRVGFNGLMLLGGYRDWRKLDSQTAADILRRYSGEKGYKAIWEPLLRNKFGQYHEEVAATWLWDRVNSRLKSKKAGYSGESLGYLEGSFQQLFEKMQSEIEANNGRFITGKAVSKIVINNGTCSGVICDGKEYSFARTIITLPLPDFVRIAPDLPPAYAHQLKKIKYSHSLVVIVRLKERLSPFYWTNIGDANIPFAVVIEHTNMISPQKYKNEHLVYLSKYLSDDELDIFKTSDEQLFSEFSQHLSSVFPNYDETKLIGYQIFRDRYTQPIFIKNYSQLKPDFKTPVKNLFLANTSQFYPESRTMNTSFRLALKLKKSLETD